MRPGHNDLHLFLGYLVRNALHASKILPLMNWSCVHYKTCITYIASSAMSVVVILKRGTNLD